MLRNNIELDVKTKCIEEKVSQHQVAENIGTSGTYISRLINHVVLHKELANMRAFSDFDMFGMNDQCEHEANVFAAELLLDDDVVLDALNDDMTFFGAAKTLCVPPELLDFKFRVLKHQGYKISPIMIANSRFLKNIPTSEY